jgi:hypothetical protein
MGSAAGPQGRPLLRGGGERRVDRISDLRVCPGDGSFSTQAYPRDAFMLEERLAARYREHVSDRGCPSGTELVRLMWHAGGTASEDDAVRSPMAMASALPRVRPILRDHLPCWQATIGVRQLRCERIRLRAYRKQLAAQGFSRPGQYLGSIA